MTTVQRDRAWVAIEVGFAILAARYLMVVIEIWSDYRPAFEQVYYWCFFLLGPLIGIGCAGATIDPDAPLFVAFGNVVAAGVLATEFAWLFWLVSAYTLALAYDAHASGTATALSASPGLIGGIFVAYFLRKDFQPPTYAILPKALVVATILGVPELCLIVLLFAGGPN